MRLALSLGLWLTGAVATILGAHGWLQLRAEETNLEATAHRELMMLATAVRSHVENAIRDDQELDVTALLEQLEIKDPTVDIFVLEADGTLLTSSRGSADNLPKVRAILSHARPASLLHTETAPSGEFVAIAPLRRAGLTSGHLLILRPSTSLRGDLAAERRGIIVSVGVLIAAVSAVIWGMVRLRVQRPLGRIGSAVRRIGSGDLSARIHLPGRDELAALAREFDGMAEALERAQRQIAVDAEGRERFGVAMQRANRMAIVGELSATLAHEIGSPLQVLNGRARDLAARSDLPKDAQRSAAILVEQTDRVHRIVERLLDVARRRTPDLVEFDVQKSVEQVVELVSAQARQASVRLHVEVRDVPRLHGDPEQVQQVLLNLLQNALRATPRNGEVRITLSRSSFERTSGSGVQPSVAIIVEDTGRGIPEALADEIFDPFFTEWEGESKQKGTGLGLAVVRSIVKDHGGSVSAARGLSGSGARFVVHFPLGDARLAPAMGEA